MAYVVIAKWTVNKGEEAAVAAALKALTEASRAEPGNLVFQPHRDPKDPRVFLIYEQYLNEQAFLAHGASEHFQRHAFGDAIPRLAGRERTFYETWA